MLILIINLRWSSDRLKFIMGIPIPVRHIKVQPSDGALKVALRLGTELDFIQPNEV